jgi:hypothetical protein
MTRRKWTALTPVLAVLLAGCGAREIMMGVATLGGAAVGAGGREAAAPAPAAGIDQRLLKAAAKRAIETLESFTTAAKARRIPMSPDPDTARPNFCRLVVEGLAILDESQPGSRGSALSCWIEHHASRAAAAVDANDPAAYAENVGKLDTYTDQLVALVRAANASQGAAQ